MRIAMRRFLRRLFLPAVLLTSIMLAACEEPVIVHREAVIVELKLDHDGETPSVGMMRANAKLQKELVDRALAAGMELRNIRTYQVLPQLAVTLDQDGVMFFLQQDEVVSVRPDRINSPRAQ